MDGDRIIPTTLDAYLTIWQALSWLMLVVSASGSAALWLCRRWVDRAIGRIDRRAQRLAHQLALTARILTTGLQVVSAATVAVAILFLSGGYGREAVVSEYDPSFFARQVLVVLVVYLVINAAPLVAGLVVLRGRDAIAPYLEG